MNEKKSIFPTNQIVLILGMLLFLTLNCNVVDNQRNIPEIPKYDQVQIGTQVWMDKNLYETHYQNGDPIPLVTGVREWKSMKTGAYCYYDNDENNIDTYGLLYNWYAVVDTRDIAPTTWHVPNYEEWIELLEFIGGDEVAGSILKEEGTEHWTFPNSSTNEIGFSALPGGARTSGYYTDIGTKAGFWTTTIEGGYSSSDRIMCIVLYCDTSKVYRDSDFRSTGYSVRCIKNTYKRSLKSETQDVKKMILIK